MRGDGKRAPFFNKKAKLGRWERVMRWFYLAGGLYCLIFGLFPLLLYFIMNEGVVLLLVGAAALLPAALLLPRLKGKWPRTFRYLHPCFAVGCLCAFSLYAGFFFYYHAYCAAQRAPQGDGVPRTVVVLGCAIEGDKPKLMLERRLRVAAGYLKENPAARCIVSGGLGRGERYTEAAVMERFLREEMGIEAGRIYQEGRSRNTRENIGFSAALLAEKRLPAQVVVVTDAFHQPRAGYFCGQNGLQPLALTSRTPWGLVPSSALREMGAWVLALLT